MKSSNTKCDICLKSWEHIHGGPSPHGTPSDVDITHWLYRALIHNSVSSTTIGEIEHPAVAHACADCLREAARLIEKFVAQKTP